MKLFVGNLSLDETEDTLRLSFVGYGAVNRVRIETHHTSGRSKGFGLVEMTVEGDAERAIAGLDGKERNGRRLTVASVGPYKAKSGSHLDTKRRY